MGKHRGWLKVEPIAGRNALAVEIATSLMPALPEIMSRLKNLFDLSARPDVIASHLSADERLRGVARRCAGLRVPGAFDGFELAVRAILGQRVSVRAATTLAGRLAARFGEPIETPFPGLDRLSPTPAGSPWPRRPRSRRWGSRPLARRASARSRRPSPGASSTSQPGADPVQTARALQAFPGNRRLDRPVHRHASAALARRLPRRRPGACSRRPARHHRGSFASAPKPGAPGGPMRPCISGNPNTLVEEENLDD